MEKENWKVFRERLNAEYGNHKFKTRSDFAEKIGVRKSTVSRWFTYDNEDLPNSNSLIRLCKVLNVDSDYLLGLSDVKKWEGQTLSKEVGLSEESASKLFNASPELKHTLEFILLASEGEQEVFNKAVQYIESEPFEGKNHVSAYAQECGYVYSLVDRLFSLKKGRNL